MLERDGHRVVSAETATRADELLHSESFDVIVLDIALPDGSGLDLCRQLRKREVATPVLILTARSAVHQRVAE